MTKHLIQPGEITNPTGANGVTQGYQNFRARALYLLDTLSTQEIIDRARSINIRSDSPEEMKRRHKETMAMAGRDVAIILALADSFTKGGATALNRLLLNNVLGKGAELVINQNFNNNVTYNEANRLETVREIEQWIEDITVAEPAPAIAPPVPD